MSAKCQKRTSPALFDQLVGKCEQHGRYRQAERFLRCQGRYKLLGDVTLATKAEQMSEKLYILDHQDFGLPFVSAAPTFAMRGQ